MKNLLYLLSIVVVALALFAFDTNRKHTELQQTLHAHYTNDVTKASEKLTMLNRTISQSLLFKDERALTSELDTIWRISSELRGDVADLPIQNEVRTEWMRYLGKIGNSAKQVASNGDQQAWREQMEKVDANLQAFTEEWTVATTNFYNNDGNYNKWSDNQLAELSASPFQAVSKQLTSYNETDFPLTASESDYEKKRDLQHLTAEPITKKQAIEKFKLVFPTIDDAALTVSKSHDDAPYPFYHLQYVRGSRIGYADITEKGGEILSFLLERPIRKEVLMHEEIVTSAKKFMTHAGFKDVEITESRENHEAWHFVFTRMYKGAYVYPDSIQVKVAKDNGEVLGINAMEYVQKETIAKQTVNEVDWKEFFDQSITVAEVKDIYTANDLLQLRRCYEVIAYVPNEQNDTFRIVIDAETHEVIKTEQLP